MQNRKAPLASGVPLKKEAGSNDSGDRLWEELKLGLKRQLVRDDLKLLGLKRLLVWDDQLLGLKRLLVLFNGTNNTWVHQEGQEREDNQETGHKVLSIQQA